MTHITLKPGDEIRAGDEWFDLGENRWKKTAKAGDLAGKVLYRRPTPDQPQEAKETPTDEVTGMVNRSIRSGETPHGALLSMTVLARSLERRLHAQTERADAAEKERDEAMRLLSTEMTETDSYGVEGSDFYRCMLCGGESGAGVLNNGIQHEDGCLLSNVKDSHPIRETLRGMAHRIEHAKTLEVENEYLASERDAATARADRLAPALANVMEVNGEPRWYAMKQLGWSKEEWARAVEVHEAALLALSAEGPTLTLAERMKELEAERKLAVDEVVNKSIFKSPSHIKAETERDAAQAEVTRLNEELTRSEKLKKVFEQTNSMTGLKLQNARTDLLALRASTVPREDAVKESIVHLGTVRNLTDGHPVNADRRDKINILARKCINILEREFTFSTIATEPNDCRTVLANMLEVYGKPRWVDSRDCGRSKEEWYRAVAVDQAARKALGLTVEEVTTEPAKE